MKKSNLNQFQPVKIHAAILAGGKSTRMQKDKRFLTFRGKTLIDHTIELAKNVTLASCGEVIICGTLPDGRGIPDEVSGLGPIGGLATAFRYFNTQQDAWLLVLPVDMPLLNTNIIFTLVQVAEEQKQVESVQFKQYHLPMLVRMGHRARQVVKVLCSNDNYSIKRSIRTFASLLNTVSIDLHPNDTFHMTNTNTPEEWDSLHRRILA